MKPVSESYSRPGYVLRALFIFFLFLNFSAADASIFEGGDVAKGESLFKANCASCHRVTEEVLAAPGLKGVDQRWKGNDNMMVKWIQNPQAAAASGDPYIKSIVDKYVGTYGWMTAQAVSEADIKDIMAYVKTGGPPPPPPSETVVETGTASHEEGGSTIWFIIIGLVLAVVAVSAANISRSLKNAINERDGKEPLPDFTYGQAARRWMWNNKIFVSLVGLFLFCWICVEGYGALMDIGVYEKYEPEQPIAFSHNVHAKQNEIDCQYCHSSASKSKHAGIPSANVCMNCHKGVKKGTKTGTTEIEKIYAAIGFDPVTGTYKTNYAEQPIEWVKVHNLPDHVYFSHSTHVSIAKLDCKQCHGPVQTFGVGRQASVEEINAQEDVTGLIQLTKPTLTMGWCIECHNKAEIDLASSDYYITLHERMKGTELGQEKLRKIFEDGAVTVREMGGWECGKCHY